MKKINKFLEKYIKKIIIIYIYAQPLLDVSAAISTNYLNIPTISSIIRLIFLMLSILYLIFIDKTKNKKQNILFIILLITYIITFSISTIIYKEPQALTYELKNTINTFYFPVILITLLSIFEQYNLKIKLKNIIITYIIYLIFIIIPNITNTGFNSYWHSKQGNVGWFLSANAVGNTLSILLPFITIYIIKNKTNIIKKIIITISILYASASIGTKVPILSIGICTIGTLIYYLIEWIKNKKYKQITLTIITTIIITITSIIIIPKTAFYKNIQIHKNYLGFNNYLEVITNYKLIDHFIFSQRLTFLKNTNETYKQAHLPEKILGIGYIENYGTDQTSTKTIEIDYFEIFYRNGIIGTLLYLYILIPLSKKLINKLKKHNLINTQYKLSILLILLLALFSGHILVTPAVSIFVALIITIILQGGLYEEVN